MLNIVEYWMFDDIGPLVHCLDLDSHSTCGIRLQLAEALEPLVPQLVQKAGTTSTVCQLSDMTPRQPRSIFGQNGPIAFVFACFFRQTLRLFLIFEALFGSIF